MSGVSAGGLSKLEGKGSGPEWWGAHEKNNAPGYPSYTDPSTPIVEGDYGPGVAGWRYD